VPQRRFDGFDRFVGPGLDRHRLAEAFDAVLVGQPQHDGRPRLRLEELELADQRIVDARNIDADDTGHWPRASGSMSSGPPCF